MSFDFINEFYRKIKELEVDWEVKGLISREGKIYTLGSDSKLIGRIFELIVAPIIKEIASDQQFILKIAESQNTYPDFTLMKDETDKEKIAIDVKTTYRRRYRTSSTRFQAGELRNFGYTLGSFASFLRNGTKNIQYHYEDYRKHYIIGFLYDRINDSTEGEIVDYSNITDISPPFRGVEYFVQEKYKIAGDKPGSGNTENIGSFSTNNLNELIEGKGPFSMLGDDVFEHYWQNYPKYRELNPKYTNLHEYFVWLNYIEHEYKSKEKLFQKWLKNNEE